MQKWLAIAISALVYSTSIYADSYVSLNLAWNFQNADIETINLEGEGFVYGASIGTDFARNVSLELEYRNTHAENVDINSALFNVVYDFGAYSDWTPYILGGLGWASVSTDSLVDANSWTYQIGTGLQYKMDTNYIFDIGYRFQGFGDLEEAFNDLEVDQHIVTASIKYLF